ncbi:DUF305 domain-containing protein [Microbacterium sp. X-17]|uniref:DUF305 domain-containing protein n=1 Tax=Microbacterium sp. X-17 TaxID=3144404 RepID=UPI0031F4D921
MRIRPFAPAAGAIALVLLLAGCAQATGGTMPDGMPGMNYGSSPSTSAAMPADVDAADEMFVVMMIPHHQQAVEMSDAVLAKSGVDDRVRALAQQIKAAQGPEIEKMKGWLQDWGVSDSPSMMSGGMGGMGDGMMSDDDMTALESATGADASTLFLRQMIVHHQGAIAMATSVLDAGRNSEVAALANAIIAGQTAEIATMQGLLGTS